METDINEDLKFVKKVAMAFKSTLPVCIELSDLIQVGYIGLMQAAKTFDPERKCKFHSYAYRRVRGSMEDYLRELDDNPRLVRKRQKEINKAIVHLSSKLKRPPSTEEVRKYLNLSEAQYKECVKPRSTQSLEYQSDSFGVSLKEILMSNESSPTNKFILHEKVKKLLSGLNKKERLILICYYMEEQTLKEIGDQLNLSQSRVSQLHANLLKRLRLQYDAI